MTLPHIKLPLFELTLPSTNEKIKFKPFTVKEEKLLLIAQESANPKDRITAMRQIVTNCLIDNKDVTQFPAFDLEYCFIKIAAKSITNESNLAFRDPDDGKVYNFTIDLDELEVTKHPEHNNVIDLDSGIGVIMRYPTIEVIESIAGSENESEELLYHCIESIYDEETSYDVSLHTRKELEEFVESIPRKSFEKIVLFFETMPELIKELTYKDSNGTEKKIILRDVDDFFPRA